MTEDMFLSQKGISFTPFLQDSYTGHIGDYKKE